MIELKFEEERQESINNIIEVIPTQMQELPLLNFKERPLRVNRSIHKLGTETMAAMSNHHTGKPKQNQDQESL